MKIGNTRIIWLALLTAQIIPTSSIPQQPSILSSLIRGGIALLQEGIESLTVDECFAKAAQRNPELNSEGIPEGCECEGDGDITCGAAATVNVPSCSGGNVNKIGANF